MLYLSKITYVECDPVTGKCDCWDEGKEDDKKEDCWKYLAPQKDVDPEFVIFYNCVPATIFSIPIPFWNM